jgi:transposase-like protein
MGDTWYLDEVFVKIQGRQQYLWRAVDEDGDVIDILVQSRRNRWAAIRFFRKLFKGQGCAPRRLITDKLRSYPAACRTVIPSVVHCTDRSGPKSLTKQPDSRNARCAASSPPGTRNGFSRCTDPCRISFEWADICSAPCTTVS